jgi:hypothetical protein
MPFQNGRGVMAGGIPLGRQQSNGLKGGDTSLSEEGEGIAF